jgi:hypothetical protein
VATVCRFIFFELVYLNTLQGQIPGSYSPWYVRHAYGYFRCTEYLGLFQCSGAFVTSEERSIVFWLFEKGYVSRPVQYTFVKDTITHYPQRLLGNTRGIFGIGHNTFGRGDPRF